MPCCRFKSSIAPNTTHSSVLRVIFKDRLILNPAWVHLVVLSKFDYGLPPNTHSTHPFIGLVSNFRQRNTTAPQPPPESTFLNVSPFSSSTSPHKHHPWVDIHKGFQTTTIQHTIGNRFLDFSFLYFLPPFFLSLSPFGSIMCILPLHLFIYHDPRMYVDTFRPPPEGPWYTRNVVLVIEKSEYS